MLQPAYRCEWVKPERKPGAHHLLVIVKFYWALLVPHSAVNAEAIIKTTSEISSMCQIAHFMVLETVVSMPHHWGPLYVGW